MTYFTSIQNSDIFTKLLDCDRLFTVTVAANLVNRNEWIAAITFM